MLHTDLFITAAGTVISFLGGVWWIVTYKTNSLEKRMDAQDERIFQLATGKTLREAMLEAKQKGQK